MTTFTIDEQNQIVTFATAEAAAPRPPIRHLSPLKGLTELATRWVPRGCWPSGIACRASLPSRNSRTPKARGRVHLGAHPEPGRTGYA